MNHADQMEKKIMFPFNQTVYVCRNWYREGDNTERVFICSKKPRCREGAAGILWQAEGRVFDSFEYDEFAKLTGITIKPGQLMKVHFHADAKIVETRVLKGGPKTIDEHSSDS